MLSSIIIRSAAAFGGAPFRLVKSTALGSAAGGAAGGAAAGGVPGALVGGALGLASSLLGGLFGKSNTQKTNQMNYRIMLEQNRFNAVEAKKNRDWQELMYRMFGTSSAKANDMRAAGLNALLGDVSASGNVGSGGAATAAESAQMMPTDYSFIGDAANRGLAAYNTTRSVDASVSLQKSQENVNKSIEGVNMAQKGFMESQTDMQKMTYKFAMDTYQNRLLQEQFKAELANWQGFDAMYDARLKAFSLYNVLPQEVEKNVAQTMSFYASAFRDIASGKYTLKQTENYGKWLSIQQTFAHAATVQGQAALMQGRAAITNANANSSYLQKLGSYYGSLTSGQNISNQMQQYYTDFMLGKMPIGKAELFKDFQKARLKLFIFFFDLIFLFFLLKSSSSLITNLFILKSQFFKIRHFFASRLNITTRTRINQLVIGQGAESVFKLRTEIRSINHRLERFLNFTDSLRIGTHIIDTLQQRNIGMKRSTKRIILFINRSNFMLNFLVNRRNKNYFIFCNHNRKF
jgi:hypothetical protein